jgi:hypothetical protein
MPFEQRSFSRRLIVQPVSTRQYHAGAACQQGLATRPVSQRLKPHALFLGQY